MVLINLVTGAYKPTNITGGPHIVEPDVSRNFSDLSGSLGPARFVRSPGLFSHHPGGCSPEIVGHDDQNAGIYQ